MFRQIVIHDQGVATLLGELFTDCAAGVGCDVLQGRRVICRRGDDHGVFHSPGSFKGRDQSGYRGALLPDRHIDTNQILAFLIDDRIDRQSRLPGLAISDDQLALPSTNWDHRIDGFDPCLDRGIHVLSFDHPCRDPLDRAVALEFERALPIERFTQGVHHASNQAVAHRDRGDAPSAVDRHAFLNPRVLSHDDHADRVALQVEGDAHHVVGETD